MRPEPTSVRCRSAAKRCCVRSVRRASAGRSALELLRPDSVETATSALGNGSVALAGGTELVPLLREGIVEADTLVQIWRGPEGHPRGLDRRRHNAGRAR